jgi:hypothetical protein
VCDPTFSFFFFFFIFCKQLPIPTPTEVTLFRCRTTKNRHVNRVLSFIFRFMQALTHSQEPCGERTTAAATAVVTAVTATVTAATHDSGVRAIVQERERLDAWLQELLQREVVLQRDHAALKHQCGQLHKRCSHPRQRCSWSHGPYSERESYCPDCGQQDFG